MKKYLGLFSLLFTLSFMTSNTAFAIKYGSLDGENHPYVGIVFFFTDQGAYNGRCSGSLISPKVFVTAGHCTVKGNDAFVYFESDANSLKDPGSPNWGDVLAGQSYTHPNYVPEVPWLFDVGVVVLDAPFVLLEYAALPVAGELDAMKTERGKQNTTFTAVGYGVQWKNPVFLQADWVRMSATLRLIEIDGPSFNGEPNGFSMLLSSNRSTGGTCSADSGGPSLIGDSNVIGGVASYAFSITCSGATGVYRLDKQHNLDFINSFLQ